MTPAEALARNALALALHSTRIGNDAPEFDMDVARARADRMLTILASPRLDAPGPPHSYEVRPPESGLRAALAALDRLDEVAPTLWQQQPKGHPLAAMQIPVREWVRTIRAALAATPAPPEPLDVEALKEALAATMYAHDPEGAGLWAPEVAVAYARAKEGK